MKLNLELVPATCWFNNVRSFVSKSQWLIISKQVRSQAYDICEVCGSSSEQFLDCHEAWEYDDKKHIQKLIKMIALCKSCHMVKHFGFAQVQGKDDQALQHLMKVNGLQRKEAKRYIQRSMEQWTLRSCFSWSIDITHLKTYGIDITKIRNIHD